MILAARQTDKTKASREGLGMYIRYLVDGMVREQEGGTDKTLKLMSGMQTESTVIGNL